MPVEWLQGGLHEVIEWDIFFALSPASRNVSVWPGRITGGVRRGSARLRAPSWYLESRRSTKPGFSGPSGSVRGSGMPVGPPPWLSFSGRWPCVTEPLRLTFVLNGFWPGPRPAMYATMIPIDSHHAPREVSEVALVESTSPFRS